MKVRLYLSLFLLTVSTSLFSNSVTQLDSFPELKIIEKHRIDTVTIFDYDTQEEKVTVVKNISEFVAIIDTTVTFDYNKYEETVTVRRDTISLYEYYKRYGSERCNAIEKYLKSLDLWKEGDLDTTHVSSIDKKYFLTLCKPFLRDNNFIKNTHRNTFTTT